MEHIYQRNSIPSIFNAGGEMSGLILRYNWADSLLGPIEQWPLSLRTTVGNMLHSAFPMFLFWGDDHICFYNDAYRPSLGNEGKHPAIGKNGKDVWPEIWEFIGPLIDQVLTTGKPAWFVDQLVPFYRNNRLEDIYWTFSYSAAFGDNGEIAGVIVTCMETTDTVNARRKIEQVVAERTEELKKAHASLMQANNYLQRIINLFKEPLQVLEPVMENDRIVDFKFKLTNAAFAAYANTTPDKLVNRRVGDVFPGYFKTSSFSKVAEAFQTGIADTWEIHYNEDGLDLYNQMSATRLNNEVVVHFTDFTKLKNLQNELMSKIQELERSNQHLEEFAHAASHDLKEPIRKIQVFTSMLKEQLIDHLRDAELRTFERIENSTRRMSLLIDDLLLYSHVSQGIHQKEMVDLNEKIGRVMEDLELQIQQKNVKINVDPMPTVFGYRRQLQQMFQNLISNAIKYNQSQPEIHISAESVTLNGQPFHLIRVHDNGIGFEPQYADKIFHMFNRLHGKNEFGGGTGVGLAIVKKVVENHQGFVRAESEPGKGSTFSIWLPADEEAEEK